MKLALSAALFAMSGSFGPHATVPRTSHPPQQAVAGAYVDSAAHVFAPGIISSAANDASPAFTPDGRTVFFSRANANQSVILVSRRRGGSWSTPTIAPFSGQWRDLEATMAPDGSYLIFASNRPLSSGGKALDGYYNGAAQPGKGGNLWRVDRTASGWGAPRRLPDVVNSGPTIFSPSIAADGSVYFMRPTGASTRFHLFRAQFRNDSYELPTQLSFSSDEANGDFDPAVAANESFIVFSSARPPAKGTSLFIAVRNRDGSWNSPRYMGAELNAGGGNIEARLSPDNHVLYFSSSKVVPVTTPSGVATTTRELAEMTSWNNGLLNIWYADLGDIATSPMPDAARDDATVDVKLASPPQIVGVGVISTPAEEFKATVSPDGKSLLYTVTDHQFRHMTIVQSRTSGSDWSSPEVAEFSGVWRDGDPSFAPDGRRVFFISNRPLPGDSSGTVRRDFNIWSVAITSDGSWGEPVALARAINTSDAEFAPSVAANGDLYFSRGDSMYVAARAGDGFASPVALPFDGGDPAISSDGKFLIFDKERVAGDVDLFISCRDFGKWTTPRRFAEPVNSTFEEGDPSISSDGHTLYFFSTRSASASVRAPRTERATFRQLQQEAREVVLNGSRNLYQVDISSLRCPAQ